MDSELRDELRALEARVHDSIQTVRSDNADALQGFASEFTALRLKVAEMASNEKDINRLAGELESLRRENQALDKDIQDIKLWRAEIKGSAVVEARNTAFWKGVGGRLLGGILLVVILGASGTLLGVYVLLQSAAIAQ